MPGLIAEKIGMTQIFSEAGNWIPVTLLQAGPCIVVRTKTQEKHGYRAVQLGFKEAGRKKTKRKPYAGHFSKVGLKVNQHLKEIRTEQAESYQVGHEITVAGFQMGDIVDVKGISKGKGFQGVMKRHHFAGGPASHGCSVSHRAPGSIGQRTYPGRVFKGRPMAGRMGGEKTTVKNLEIVGIENEQNLILIRGAVPGPNHSIVMIYPCNAEFEKRILETKKVSA